MLELVATGRLAPETLVSEDGDGFRPARQIEALAFLTSRPAYRFSVPDAASARWHSQLDRAQLPALLFDLVLRRETGVLVAKSSRRQKRIYFDDGAVRFISSTDRGELLGTRLVHAGLASKAEVERALVECSERGQGHLGEALVDIGALRPMSLLRALVEQVEARFDDLLRWTEGELWFVRGEQAGEDRIRAQMPSAELLTRAVRAGYGERELLAFLGPRRAEPIARVPGARITPARLALPIAERRALELAGGSPSLEALVARLAADRRRDAGAGAQGGLRRSLGRAHRHARLARPLGALALGSRRSGYERDEGGPVGPRLRLSGGRLLSVRTEFGGLESALPGSRLSRRSPMPTGLNSVRQPERLM